MPSEGLCIPGREQGWRREPGPPWAPPCAPAEGGYSSLYQSAISLTGHVTNSPTLLMAFNSFMVYFLLSFLWVCWGSADPGWSSRTWLPDAAWVRVCPGCPYLPGAAGTAGVIFPGLLQPRKRARLLGGRTAHGSSPSTSLTCHWAALRTRKS